MGNSAFLKIVLGVVIFLAFLAIITTRLDPDLGWHLRVGENIIKEKQPPHFDTFSHTMSGYSWIDHEWLTDAFLAWLKAHDLWVLVIFIFTILAFVPFAVWLRRARTWSERFLMALLAILMLSYLGIRPHLITFFLFFAVFEVLYRKYIDQNQDRQMRFFFFSLPLIFLVWVNLHGGFFLGLLTFGIFLAFSRPKLFDWLWWAFCFAATFVNPYGWRIYEELFQVFSSSATVRYINEWQSALFLPSLTKSLPSSIFLFVALLIFLPVFLCLAVKYWNKYPRALLLTAVIYFLGYLKSLKLGPVFFVSVAPFFTLGLEFLRHNIESVRNGRPFSPRELRALKLTKEYLTVFLLAFAVALFIPPSAARAYPEEAITFLRKQNEGAGAGKLFNEYGWGGYLIWALPEVKVFIDGRMPHWQDKSGHSAMAEYSKVFYPLEDQPWQWEEVFAKHQIGTVLMNNPECARGQANLFGEKLANSLKSKRLFANYYRQAQIPCQLIEALLERGWSVIYKDEAAVILKK